ncbi:cytochrome b5 [Bacillus idriensis]|uniref:Cytochrome b5 n=1 Tax=Metabacillus idriensis TaxID=324768 RepID=A0A6I2M6I2_9BACI|nr:cytochrome b5 domain-containing protein [Metabacillus idriensis]MRX52954.1 cytochrome b5 [Metabacillus idriensis]
MQNTELLRMQLNDLIAQARYDIYTMSNLRNPTANQQHLQRLWNTLSMISFHSNQMANQCMTNNRFLMSNQAPYPNPSISKSRQRTFTIGELAVNDGKNGKPAYVAVNGTVYDVTNNRAWAAGTHFALTAGKEYSAEFASCHAGQEAILSTLPAVGRLSS